jgi:4-alpha-glucanotransferase
LAGAFDHFARDHASWLEDFALFMVLKAEHGGRPWPEWDTALARREPAALDAARRRLAGALDAQRFRQFLFFRQWGVLRDAAHARDIRLFGDIPIFVAHDSAEVWAHPELFQLGPDGRPTVVAGVPPDYFSATGQLWGNPLYRWDVIEASGFSWWLDRIRAALELVDMVRLDHFRGFEAFWEVPAGAPTAEKGRWVKVPGHAFFSAIRAQIGEVPIVAEDLGYITPEVHALRDAFDLPGMKILQFGFGGGPHHPFLPHNYPKHCVVYTGTHDNEPSRAWFESASDKERGYAQRYLECDASAFTWQLIRAALASVAHTAIVPLQDVLELGAASRLNFPGRPSGNWTWRFRWEELVEWRLERLATMTEDFGRALEPPETVT